MAVSRGGVAFWVGCVRNQGRRQSLQKWSWSFRQVVDCQWICQTCPLSSAPWAVAPPNSLRYQNFRQPVLSNPLHHASQPQSLGYCEEEWEESLSVCVLVRQREPDDLHTVLEIPVFGHNKIGKPLASSDFSFPLTTVDGRREDDISIETFQGNGADAARREHGCFRSLFETEGCPAPFMSGSRFYCFHFPGAPSLKSSQDSGLDKKPTEPPPVPSVSLCSHASRAEGEHTERDGEGEEKLTMMYEKLRTELPSFFMTRHDYTMYSDDVEFINGLMNFRTRGRVIYRFTISFWCFLCISYYSEARLDVLKLTKHTEDGTIKARWRIRGLPRHSVLLHFYRKDKLHLYRSLDAFSTFYVGHDGLIHCHKVEKVMPARPPVLPTVTSLLTGALVALGVQEDRPALNLLPLLLSLLRLSRN